MHHRMERVSLQWGLDLSMREIYRALSIPKSYKRFRVQGIDRGDD
jgi:hypothetical protein